MTRGSARSSCASTHHVLIASADVGGYNAKKYAVVDFLTIRRNEFWVINTLNFDFSWSDVDDSTIGSHRMNFP